MSMHLRNERIQSIVFGWTGYKVLHYLRVHETKRKAHSYREKPDKDNLQCDSASCLVPTELHGIAET